MTLQDLTVLLIIAGAALYVTRHLRRGQKPKRRGPDVPVDRLRRR